MAHDVAEEITVIVPPSAKPGASVLQITLPSGPLRFRVPQEAQPGDELVICVDPGGGVDSFSIRRTAASGTSGATASGGSKRRREEVVVPDGAKPGTEFEVDIGNGESLRVIVPATAKPGERLCLEEGEDGSWTCQAKVLRRSRKSSSGPAKAEVQVPKGAVPGQTVLRILAGPSPDDAVLVTLPEDAREGDKLNLVQDAEGTWSAHVERSSGAAARMSLCMTKWSLDNDALFAALVESARAAGAFVSPKLHRGSVPPLHIIGVVARDAISSGEELCRVPGSAMLSVKACEEVLPELYGAVQALQRMPEKRRPEAGQAACLTAVLAAAQRSLQGVDDDSDRAGAVTAACRSGRNAQVLHLWDCYAKALLNEACDEHPYWRGLDAEDAVNALLNPSNEGRQVHDMAVKVLAMYRCIVEGVAPEVLGPDFEPGLYLKATLAQLSRVFTTGLGTALVPVIDLCNHAGDANSEWLWDEEGHAHVLRASRDLSRGDEVLISYGAHSNAMLFRTYGFTLPPQDEHSWSCAWQHVKPRELYAKYLPPDQQDLVLYLDTKGVQESLVKVLNACADHGRDAVEFLTELCGQALAAYEADASLAPALAALRRVREVDPTSAAWWGEVDPSSLTAPSELGGAWGDAALRVKMCEYLCLLAHLEAADLAAGRQADAGCCLARGNLIRNALLGGFEVLRQGSRFQVQIVPADS